MQMQMQTEDTAYRAIAIVGAGAVLPDAPNINAFWNNVKSGRYSITEVTPDRWDPAFYYDTDHAAPDKTYSKIGGWVRDQVWDPVKWHLPIPPRVTDAMDQAQKWAIAASREALEDYGYPQRPLNPDRVAVILGNAMAGEKHYLTPTNSPKSPASLPFLRKFAPESRANYMSEWVSTCPKLPKIACPENWPTALPDASPISTTSTARISFATQPAPPPWPR